MTRLFHTSHAEQIRLGERIGGGGEGEVYDVAGRDDLVAKIYHEPPQPEKAEKLTVLARLGSERLFRLSAWPVDVLRDRPDGPVVGFSMKKIGDAEEVHTLHSPKSRLLKFPDASWAFLIHVAANIARAVAVMHEHGFVIGDVNPKNILVTRRATIHLLDCDSFQVSENGRTFRCEGGFGEYTPPELQGVAFREVDRTQMHDCFGLAVVIFQLLFMGRHPFSGRYTGAGEMPLERAISERRFAWGADAAHRQMQPPPGTLSLAAIPDEMAELFRRAFLSFNRPQPREWIEPLEHLSQALKRCSLHSGHHYFQKLANCPWCDIEMRARIRLFNFAFGKAGQPGQNFRLDEIWRQIESVPVPPAPLLSPDRTLDELQPSPEAMEIARTRTSRHWLSLFFAAICGFVIGLVTDFPLAIWLLALAGLLAKKISKVDTAVPQMQTLFQNQQVPQEPDAIRIQTLKEQAETAFRQLEQQWQKEAGSNRFLAGLSELQNRREAWENLTQIREWHLRELESQTREAQLGEFLNQFAIAESDIQDIKPRVKTTLLSRGIETAADVTETNLERLRIDSPLTKRLLRWRQGLEEKFVFDPARDVPHQARLKVEREMDELRLRLEHELSNGATYLRRLEHEIDESRRRLAPLLTEARRRLAQAERDLEAVAKSFSIKPLVFILIMAFFVGTLMEPAQTPAPPAQPANASREKYDPPPRASSKATATALELHRQGRQLMEKEKYFDAAEAFKKAAALDPLVGSQVNLAEAYYRLGWYDAAIATVNEALRIGVSFDHYYILGLAYAGKEQWSEAREALLNALNLRPVADWGAKYTEAYRNLGLAQVKLGEASQAISRLEGAIQDNPNLTIERLELGNLYLWTGNIEGAREQLRELQTRDKVLAEALDNLISRFGIR
ncbi:MAG TPA: tetratricopeptide repeat protein [Blastocatellia bacterium]|nr:tetratricopeptide repeat protein [Blastocatellia bacterium]